MHNKFLRINIMIIFWIICILCKTVISFLNNHEMTIVSEVSKKFKIDHCIFIRDGEGEPYFLLNLVKYFNGDISATFLRNSQLIEYISETNNLYFNVIIVLREKNVLGIGKLLKKLKRKLMLYNKMSRYTWLVFLESKELPEDEKILLPVSYDCEFIIVQTYDEIDYILKEIYKINNHSFISAFGKWNSENGLNIQNEYIYQRRLNLNQTEILLPFYAHPNLEKSSEDRITQEVLYSISQIMNFKFVPIIKPSRNNKAIKQFYGLLMQHDIITYGDTVTLIVTEDPNFERVTIPIFTTKYNWYIKQPTFRLRSDYYIQPFQTEYWIMIIFSVVTGSIAAVITHKLVLKKENRSIIDNIYLGLEHFCNQNGNEEIKNVSLRIISLSLSLGNAFVLGSFGAVITSYLAARIPSIPFLDLQSFIENGHYRFAIPEQKEMASYIEFLILEQRNFTDEDWERFSFFYEDEKEIERICHENLVFADNDFSVYEKNISCSLYQIGKPFANKPVVLFLDMMNPFQKVCNYNILRISESGIQNRMRKNVTKLLLSKIEEDEFFPIEFQQIVQVLSIPFIGLILAVTTVVFERIYKNKVK